MSDFLEKMWAFIEESIQRDTFVRLTLSKSRQKTLPLKKVLVKLAHIKKQLQLSFTFRYKDKDITKNFSLEAGSQQMDDLLNDQFLIATLFTTDNDFVLEVGKTTRLRQLPPTFKKAPARNHDKTKNRMVSAAPFLVALNVLDARGRVKKDKGDKFRQINKFVEIINSLIRQNPEMLKKESLKVVDMGAGKGYLTFALYDYLQNILNKKVMVTGVELRKELVEQCNQIAIKSGFKDLIFEQGYIGSFPLEQVDILMALHACDTATDDAIHQGIKARAGLIICAPCCHKQIRKQIKKGAQLQPILDHGILKERQAELITDSIRALYLKAYGYKTKVFEFISTEHTGKNVMIVGQKHSGKVDKGAIFSQINGLKATFGIQKHYLDDLLNLG